MHFPFSGRGDDGNVPHPDLRAPPRFVIAIPTNRAREAFFKAELRLPINQFLEFGSVSRVPEHLSGATADKLYLAVAWSHCFQDRFRDFQHTAMSLGADVDYFASDGGDIGMNQRVQRFAVIFDVK